MSKRGQAKTTNQKARYNVAKTVMRALARLGNPKPTGEQVHVGMCATLFAFNSVSNEAIRKMATSMAGDLGLSIGAAYEACVVITGVVDSHPTNWEQVLEYLGTEGARRPIMRQEFLDMVSLADEASGTCDPA